MSDKTGRKNINSWRKNVRVDGKADGDYVLYWMQINRRLHYNFALEYAVAYANKLGKPLVILEGLACDYPWATARTSTFILEGMAAHAKQLRDVGPGPGSGSGSAAGSVTREGSGSCSGSDAGAGSSSGEDAGSSPKGGADSGSGTRPDASKDSVAGPGPVTYIPYPEQQKGSYGKLVDDLCGRAAILISDEYPVFIMRERNERLEKELSIPFHTIDANGIIPMALSEKAPYSAFIFRQLMQKAFLECWANPPQEHPLKALRNHGDPGLPEHVRDKQRTGMERLSSAESIAQFVSGLSGLKQEIGPIALKGTRAAGLERLDAFVGNDLLKYDDDRNDPDKERTSRLSPWLHFGKISTFEVLDKVFAMQPDGWDIRDARPVRGKRSGFFGGHAAVESFLDEVVTWREVGFHFAWHTPDYDQFDSLPSWARETLSDHADDPREHVYSYEELAQSRTHDPIWNAAQGQLREEGRIHNYLRMLWGKKVLEWTPDPQTALEYLIDLNNEYAIDGRDPNSYSGIFWIFGRFDRAWGPERPIFGKIRYMSSDSTRRKVQLDNYLKRYSGL